MYIIYTLHFNSFLAFVVDILTLCICVISDWTRIACKGTFSWLLNDLTAATIVGRNLGGREWWASCWQLAVGHRGAGIQVPLRNRRNQVVIQVIDYLSWRETNGEKVLPIRTCQKSGACTQMIHASRLSGPQQGGVYPTYDEWWKSFLSTAWGGNTSKTHFSFIKQPRSMELNLSDPAIVGNFQGSTCWLPTICWARPIASLPPNTSLCAAWTNAKRCWITSRRCGDVRDGKSEGELGVLGSSSH